MVQLDFAVRELPAATLATPERVCVQLTLRHTALLLRQLPKLGHVSALSSSQPQGGQIDVQTEYADMMVEALLLACGGFIPTPPNFSIHPFFNLILV